MNENNDEINIGGLSTLMETLGIEFTLLSRERTEAVMPVSRHVCQPFGILHGGATLALAESVAGQGSLLLCEADEMPVGIQVSCNHISSAREGDKVGPWARSYTKVAPSMCGILISLPPPIRWFSVRVVNSILKKR